MHLGPRGGKCKNKNYLDGFCKKHYNAHSYHDSIWHGKRYRQVFGRYLQRVVSKREYNDMRIPHRDLKRRRPRPLKTCWVCGDERAWDEMCFHCKETQPLITLFACKDLPYLVEQRVITSYRGAKRRRRRGGWRHKR